MEVGLRRDDVTCARDIQAAIERLPEGGGRVVLPALDLTLDRGLRLRSGVELVGQGRSTVLRHAPARVYPFSGYHNYGMRDAPLLFTDGLQPGMTVTMRDNTHGGFFETFAPITWVEEGWVGLDRGLHSDYRAQDEPWLATAFPLICGEDVRDVAVRSLTLDGQRDQQPVGIGACRGAALYFIHTSGFCVEDVYAEGFLGEGLGFQMCRDGRIRSCRFARNAGNGYHPGAGSTGVLFEDCSAVGNDQAGFFFCVRANHVTVRNCRFEGNGGAGVSVGTRDCWNLVEDCTMAGNTGPGILLRANERPVEVHSCRFARCTVEGNATATGRAQIDILGDAHDIVFRANRIRGGPGAGKPGLFLAPSAQCITLEDNTVLDCCPAVVGQRSQLLPIPEAFPCGCEAVAADDYRHLGLAAPSERTTE